MSVQVNPKSLSAGLVCLDAPKSQCSSLSDGESFECYGDNDISISETGGVDLELAPHLNSTTVGHNDNLPNRRWGSMRHTGKRQLGSNALAKSSSFNSSGRSSNCDTAEDMYSDVSLEDVQDINHKLTCSWGLRIVRCSRTAERI
uniref:Uncharacterized protein n=1 Tax=Anopheles merus TaxID=30066 RepID=A0A182V411_ANOME